MACREFFEALPEEREKLKERCRLIDNEHPNAVCELESVSATSPGIVKNEEFAHRFVFSPIHMDGELIKSSFFSDCQHGGLSCQRGSGKDVAPEVHDRGIAMVNKWNDDNAEDQTKAQRTYLGVVTAQVSKIRNLIPHPDAGETAGTYEQQMMAVYDTSKRGDEEHIDVFQLSVERKRSELKQARRDLALVFTRKPVH
ncbi:MULTISPECIES: hypothetical protein [Pseudomonadaceae]|uniref:hypothetical protein n=1 Tax=Pseudomonadaceae TaxID=135621 RepID=UPI00128EADA1|nr:MULTISPECIES: hypothetical protein [Pseudomonadaceae]